MLQFQPSAMADIRMVEASLATTRQLDLEGRDKWAAWFLDKMPLSGNVNTYLSERERSLGFETPLQDYFFSVMSRIPFQKTSMKSMVQPFEEISADLIQLFALAMPSVSSRYDTNPPIPRLYAPNSEAVVVATRTYNQAVSVAYSRCLNLLTIPQLKLLSMRIISIDGRERFPRTGAKGVHIKNIDVYRNEFVSYLYSPWLPEVQVYMELLLKSTYSNEEDATTTIVEIIPSVVITRAILRTSRIGNFYVSAVMALFQKRDDFIFNNHCLRYSTSDNYTVYGRSLFLNATVYSSNVLPAIIVEHITYTHAVYIPVSVGGWWTFVKYDKQRSIFLLMESFEMDDVAALLLEIALKLNGLFGVIDHVCILYKTLIVENDSCDVYNKPNMSTIEHERRSAPYNMSQQLAHGYVLEMSIIRLYLLMQFAVHNCPIWLGDTEAMNPPPLAKLKYYLSLGHLSF